MASILENIEQAPEVLRAAQAGGVSPDEVTQLHEEGDTASDLVKKILDASPVRPNPSEEAAKAAVGKIGEGVSSALDVVSSAARGAKEAQRSLQTSSALPEPDTSSAVPYSPMPLPVDVGLEATKPAQAEPEFEPQPLASLSPTEQAVADKVASTARKDPDYMAKALEGLRRNKDDYTSSPGADPKLAEAFQKELDLLNSEYKANKDRLATAEILETFARGIAQMATGLHQFKNRMPLEGVKFTPTDWTRKQQANTEELATQFGALRSKYALAEGEQDRALRSQERSDAAKRREQEFGVQTNLQLAQLQEQQRFHDLSVNAKALAERTRYAKAQGKDLDSQAAAVQKRRQAAERGVTGLYTKFAELDNLEAQGKIDDLTSSKIAAIIATTGVDEATAREIVDDGSFWSSTRNPEEQRAQLARLQQAVKQAPYYVSLDELSKEGKRVRNIYAQPTLPDAKQFAKKNSSKNAQFVDIGLTQ